MGLKKRLLIISLIFLILILAASIFIKSPNTIQSIIGDDEDDGVDDSLIERTNTPRFLVPESPLVILEVGRALALSTIIVMVFKKQNLGKLSK